MVDAASLSAAPSTVHPAKSTAFDAPPADANPAPQYSHVQVWMTAMKTSVKTVDAVLNLQVGGTPPLP